MSGGGGKGGGQSSSVEIPAWLEGASQRNVQRAESLAGVGHQNYYGPSIAAFNPAQNFVFDSLLGATGTMGFGDMGMTASEMQPTPTDFGNGLLGYETGSIADAAVDEWRGRNPSQAARHDSNFTARNNGTPGAGFASMAPPASPTGEPSMVLPPSYPTGNPMAGSPTYPGLPGSVGKGGGTTAEFYNSEIA